MACVIRSRDVAVEKQFGPPHQIASVVRFTSTAQEHILSNPAVCLRSPCSAGILPSGLLTDLQKDVSAADSRATSTGTAQMPEYSGLVFCAPSLATPICDVQQVGLLQSHQSIAANLQRLVCMAVPSTSFTAKFVSLVYLVGVL